MSKHERQASMEFVRGILKPGDTRHTILRHGAQSGMTRYSTPVVLRNGEPHSLPYHVARALGEKMVSQRGYDAVKVQGCGMDMGFSLVYDLGRVVDPDGFDTPPGYSRNEPLTHDPDGGDALHHAWL
jgi:hypothetical protein